MKTLSVLLGLLLVLSIAYAQPAPAHGLIADSVQAPLLIADYDPELMDGGGSDTEIVVQVIDNNPGDILKVVFVGSDCTEEVNTELGEETPNKIFKFNPRHFLGQEAFPVKIFIFSIDSNHENIVNNPIMGIITKGEPTSQNIEWTMNLWGVLPAPEIASKASISACGQSCTINFDNQEFSFLPNEAKNTYLLTDPDNFLITQLRAQELYNVFEQAKNIILGVYADENPNSASKDESCAGAIRIDNKAGFDLNSLSPSYNVLGHFPIFERTTDPDSNLTVMGYNGGGPDTEGGLLGFGTYSFYGDLAGPSRDFDFVLPDSVGPSGAFTRDDGFQDGSQEAIAVSAFEVDLTDNGQAVLEDWFAITNPNEDDDSYHVQFFNGDDCQEHDFELPVTGHGTQFLRVSDVFGDLSEREGVVVVTSQSGNRFMAEKYIVRIDSQETVQVVAKLDMLMSKEISRDATSRTGTAALQGKAIVRAITGSEDWKIKILNLEALKDHTQAPFGQLLKLYVTDEEENVQSLDLQPQGCLITLTPEDLGALAQQSGWPTEPKYLGITAQFASNDALGISDVIEQSIADLAIVTRGETGHHAGETAFEIPIAVEATSSFVVHISAPTNDQLTVENVEVETKAEVDTGITISGQGAIICTNPALEGAGEVIVPSGETVDVTLTCTTDPANIPSVVRFEIRVGGGPVEEFTLPLA